MMCTKEEIFVKNNPLTGKILPVLLVLLLVSVIPLHAASTNQVDRTPNVGLTMTLPAPKRPDSSSQKRPWVSLVISRRYSG
jgi:hypothetical protein